MPLLVSFQYGSIVEPVVAAAKLRWWSLAVETLNETVKCMRAAGLECSFAYEYGSMDAPWPKPATFIVLVIPQSL